MAGDDAYTDVDLFIEWLSKHDHTKSTLLGEKDTIDAGAGVGVGAGAGVAGAGAGAAG
jgi:hypothetical protein